MAELIVDIETAGDKWQNFDEHTQQLLIDRAARKPNNSDRPAEDLAKEQLGLSPFTGSIITIGVLDVATNKGAVYYDTGDSPPATSQNAEDNIKLTPLNEVAMLGKFWELAEKYQTVVTYSGRSFDLPYLYIRSAIHGIRPGKDFMRGRYLYQQQPNAQHIDLYDQLTFYGSVYNLGGLHLACRAFNIESSKNGEIEGADVSRYYHDGRYQEIAEYNARDLVATRELYQYWKKFLVF